MVFDEIVVLDVVLLLCFDLSLGKGVVCLGGWGVLLIKFYYRMGYELDGGMREFCLDRIVMLFNVWGF